MSSYRTLIKEARRELAERGLPEETAMLYMLELSNKESYNLYLDYENEVPDVLKAQYRQGMERILNHEPMQYVLGFSWFYGYRFDVDERVLIPRPETEELVALILSCMDEYFADQKEIDAADIGTGSGAIAITLTLEEPKVRMMASDISADAVAVAKHNAENLHAAVDFFVGDMAEPLIEQKKKVDFLICNPPYIPEEEVLEASVADYEPHVALFGGKDGLRFYRELFASAKKVLKPKAIMAFEIGYNQKEALLKEIHSFFGEVEAEVKKDINGKDRMLVIYFGCGK